MAGRRRKLTAPPKKREPLRLAAPSTNQNQQPDIQVSRRGRGRGPPVRRWPSLEKCSFCIEQNARCAMITPMVLALEEKAANGRKPREAAPPLSRVEVEVIALFVQFLRALGQPRSVAEIYGLLFISVRPMAMDELIERLRLSKGSTSQGLRFLHNIGAVRRVYVAGDRRAHYEAVAELRNLATRLLGNHILPQFAGSEERLGRIAMMAKGLPAEEREHAGKRVEMLRSWSRNGRRMLPLVLKMLGG
jgi:HTH-type transcriptional regulator, glycine betaine synthesis regulator